MSDPVNTVLEMSKEDLCSMSKSDLIGLAREIFDLPELHETQIGTRVARLVLVDTSITVTSSPLLELYRHTVLCPQMPEEAFNLFPKGVMARGDIETILKNMMFGLANDASYLAWFVLRASETVDAFRTCGERILFLIREDILPYKFRAKTTEVWRGK
ncbi:MAG: hypothetical protein AAGM67_00245 [Bacteroidota bacterium]